MNRAVVAAALGCGLWLATGRAEAGATRSHGARPHRALARPSATPTPSSAASSAPAGVIDLPDTPAQLVLDRAWHAEELPAIPAATEQAGPTRLVALHRQAGPGGLALSVIRFDAPNPAAWRRTTRAAYLDEIEAGVAAACPGAQGPTSSGAVAASPATCRGFRRTKRTIFESQGVPAMDLQAVNQAGATLLFRFLFFRTYTILAAIEVVPRAPAATVKRARSTLATFTPAPGWQR